MKGFFEFVKGKNSFHKLKNVFCELAINLHSFLITFVLNIIL